MLTIARLLIELPLTILAIGAAVSSAYALAVLAPRAAVHWMRHRLVR